MLPGRTGSTRMRGCIEPCSQTCRPLILFATPLAELKVVAPVARPPTRGNGMISGPNVRPPSVERRMRTSPLVCPLLVCQATQTSPLRATVTSGGQVKPSPAPEMLPARVVQVAPWLVERANRIGPLVTPRSLQTTYRLLANGLDGLLSAATHSLSRLPVATNVGPPTTAPVVGLTWRETTPPGLPAVR